MIFARSMLFNIFFFSTTFLLLLASLAVRLFAPARAVTVGVIWARMQLAAARIICGIHLKVTGREHIAPGAALIASRHESAFDTMVWLTLVPNASYVLKKELLRIPLFGGLLEPAGMIPVDREGGSMAMRGLMRAGAAAARAGKQIVIFPEGTRAEPDSALPLHPGVAALAAATGLPIIPVVTDSGNCWGRRSFRKRPGTIRVVILPPLPTGLKRAVLMPRLDAALRDGMAALAPGRLADE